MKRGIFIGFITLLSIAWIAAFSLPGSAAEDVTALKMQIEELQKRVAELESSGSAQQKVNKQEDGALGFFNHRHNRNWDPFEEMGRIQEEMNRMFQNSFFRRGNMGTGMFSSNMNFNTELDLKENKDGYEVTFDMTGLDKDKVDIQIDEHSITVKGEDTRQETEENQNSYFSSQSYGSFMKTIPLPVDADTTRVKTAKEDDKLIIRLPKKQI